MTKLDKKDHFKFKSDPNLSTPNHSESGKWGLKL